MAKKLSFDVLSIRHCIHPGCEKLIKQRLVDKDPTGNKFTHCYKHWRKEIFPQRFVGTQR